MVWCVFLLLLFFGVVFIFIFLVCFGDTFFIVDSLFFVVDGEQIKL